jgi:uncharacterized paraquat-inducible protein A
MAHNVDDNDSGPDDSEFPDPSDMDQEGDTDIVETQPCPYCGNLVYDRAERCPRCGNYISAEDHAVAKPLWFIVAAVVCLIIVAIWVFRAF